MSSLHGLSLVGNGLSDLTIERVATRTCSGKGGIVEVLLYDRVQ
jgi:hypothetical protein